MYTFAVGLCLRAGCLGSDAGPQLHPDQVRYSARFAADIVSLRGVSIPVESCTLMSRCCTPVVQVAKSTGARRPSVAALSLCSSVGSRCSKVAASVVSFAQVASTWNAHLLSCEHQPHLHGRLDDCTKVQQQPACQAACMPDKASMLTGTATSSYATCAELDLS